VATQDTVTQLISAIRRVRREIPGAADVALAAHDYDQGGKPTIAWDDPVAKAALIDGLVRDALALLEAFPPNEETSHALGLLALVAGQDVEHDEQGKWRIAQRVAPDRVISTVDPEARHMHKSRSEYRDGYKAHVAVEPETGIVTACKLTPANASDAATGTGLLKGEQPGLQVLADGAYGSGDALAALQAGGHQAAVKPFPASMPGGRFSRDDFVVDYTAGTATCPAGHTVTITAKRNAVFGTRCGACPLRSSCTTSVEGRTLRLHRHDTLLVENRRAWRDGDFADDYRQFRPMVERAIAWLTTKGNRRVRYRGVARNQLGLTHRVAAINLRRLVNLGLHHDGTTWTIVT
jgi:hypothetical protein